MDEAAVAGGELLPPLRDLLYFDTAMWADDHDSQADQLPASGINAGSAAGATALHSYAPAGADIYASRLAASGPVAHPYLTTHPLWSTLVDVYFACVKVSAAHLGCAARAWAAAASGDVMC